MHPKQADMWQNLPTRRTVRSLRLESVGVCLWKGLGRAGVAAGGRWAAAGAAKPGECVFSMSLRASHPLFPVHRALL